MENNPCFRLHLKIKGRMMHTFFPKIFIPCLGFLSTLALFLSPVLASSFTFIDLKDYRIIAVEGLKHTKDGENEISFAREKEKINPLNALDDKEKVVTFSVGKGDKEKFANFFAKQSSPNIIFTRKEVRLDNDTTFTAFTVENRELGERGLTLFAADGYFLNVTTYTCVPQLPFMFYGIDSKNTSLKNIFRTIAFQKTQDDGEKWEAWLSSPRIGLPKFEANVSALDMTISLAMNLNSEKNKTWEASEVNNFTVITPQLGTYESDLWVAVVPYSTPQDANLNEHFYDTMRAILNSAGIANTTRGRYYGGEYAFYTSTGGMGSASLIDGNALITVERNLGCSSQMADYFRDFLHKQYTTPPPPKDTSAEDIAAAKKVAPTDPAVIKQLQSELMQAVEKGGYDAIEKILQRGIDVNFLINGYTPLAKATQKDARGIMSLLFKYGAHVDGVPQDHTNWTPLAIAANNNHVYAAEYLLKQKADVNLLCHGAPPLMRAMMKTFTDQSELVQLLLDHGADPNRAKQYALNPVQFAVMNARAKYLPLLLAKGADLHVRDQYQKSLLMLVAELYPTDDGLSEEDKRKTMQFLIDNKVPMHLIDDQGKTALMYAAEFAVKENVELLLKNGADPNMKDDQGRTALYYAKISPQKGVMAVLKKYGAR